MISWFSSGCAHFAAGDQLLQRLVDDCAAELGPVDLVERAAEPALLGGRVPEEEVGVDLSEAVLEEVVGLLEAVVEVKAHLFGLFGQSAPLLQLALRLGLLLCFALALFLSSSDGRLQVTGWLERRQLACITGGLVVRVYSCLRTEEDKSRLACW